MSLGAWHCCGRHRSRHAGRGHWESYRFCGRRNGARADSRPQRLPTGVRRATARVLPALSTARHNCSGAVCGGCATAAAVNAAAGGQPRWRAACLLPLPALLPRAPWGLRHWCSLCDCPAVRYACYVQILGPLLLHVLCKGPGGGGGALSWAQGPSSIRASAHKARKIPRRHWQRQARRPTRACAQGLHPPSEAAEPYRRQ